MRFNRLLLLCLPLGMLAACQDDDVITTTPPPLAGVKYIHALSDTANVDIRMMDQVEWSPFARNLAYTQGTPYQAAEAYTRHVRVFQTHESAAEATKVITDEMVTVTPNERFTLLLTGSARGGTARFQVYNDNPPTIAAGTAQIGVRAINASGGPVDVYFVSAADDPLPAQPVVSNLAPLGASAYLTRATGGLTVIFTLAGTTTEVARVTGPNAPAALAGARPGAGVNSARTVFSVVFFPAQAAPRTGPASGGFFVDINPGEL